MIRYGQQSISENDLQEVIGVLTSPFLTQGPKVPEFEEKLCALSGSRFAIACSNATSALHMACQALGLGPGDRLWTSPITFVASANCALHCGATVDFVDIDSDTYNLSIEALALKLRRAEKTNTLPKVVVPVHFAGQPCDMRDLYSLSQEYGFHIIEDAAHALGATYQGEPVGAGKYSDITILSFHPVKMITTGEGGAALTNDPELAHKLQLLRSHGITRDEEALAAKGKADWYYEQQVLGFNFRMTDLQAALGVSQLDRLSSFVQKRIACANYYDQHLGSMLLDTPHRAPERCSSWHLYCVQVDESKRDLILDHLRSSSIGATVHYIPVHLQPYYQKLGFSLGDFPISETYFRQTITLPLHPDLTTDEQDLVIDTLAHALKL